MSEEKKDGKNNSEETDDKKTDDKKPAKNRAEKPKPSEVETPEKDAPSAHSQPPYYYDVKEPKSHSSKALVVLLILIVIALIGIVIYLLSERNANRYFLIEKDGNLIVQQGYYFPVGSRQLKPLNKDEQKSYKSIKLPPEALPFTKQNFPNRISLHTTMGNLLIKWSKARLSKKQDAQFKLGWSYLKRAQLLPGLPQATIDEMNKLKGAYIYFDGVRLIAGLDERIRSALDRFRVAKNHKTGAYDKNVDEWIAKSESILAILEGNELPAKKTKLELAPPHDTAVTKEAEQTKKIEKSAAPAKPEPATPAAEPEKTAPKPKEDKIKTGGSEALEL